MRMLATGLLVVCSVCLAANLLKSSYASLTVKPIALGVTLTEEIDQTPPEIIHVLSIDLNNPNIHLEPIPGQDTVTGSTGDIRQGREDVRQIAARHQAVAAVNGDFFPFTGDPLGAAVWNGDLYSEPYPGRTVMGIEPDGKSVLFDIVGFLGELQTTQNQITGITGVDRMVSASDTNDLVVFTPTFGPRAGIRAGCVQVVLTGVNLPLCPSKLLVGAVSVVNVSSTVGLSIPSDGVVLSALPGGQAANFLTSNLHVGDQAELVCAISPQPALADAVRLAMVPRGSDDLPSGTGAINDPAAYDWGTIREVIGGGPRLLVDDQIAVDGAQEGFTQSFIDDPNPRTGVGITADGKLLLVTVDGRQSLSKGVSLEEFAEILKRYGAVNAMNLDGGGSTTLVAEGLLINSIASTGMERPVANSLCVFASPLPGLPASSVQIRTDSPAPATNALSVEPDPVSRSRVTIGSNSATSTSSVQSANGTDNLPTIVGLPATMTVGQTAPLSISDGKSQIAGYSKNVLWQGSVDLGIAFVDQTGLITALQPGQGTVTVLYNGQIIQKQVTVLAGTSTLAQDLISAKIESPDRTKPKNTVLLVGVYDSHGMPVPNANLNIDVANGTAEDPELETDVDGGAQTSITWNRKRGGSVTISSEGLVSKTLNQP